ncbi:MAG: hypothetical protein RMH84_05685 [Sulfolobales archaeon]|nr:hypothetical protein [Sulfolobales archaeon]MCX8208707.1 hypothetical protein [Sulfolobales archaeon]MDW8011067.1 hypothetical protein [Sulfolobales archaeon]
MSSESEQEKKRDIRTFLLVVPPAEAFKKQKKPPQEKRVRLKYNPAVKSGSLHVSPELAKELPLKEFAEISVHGKRVRLKVVVDEGVPSGEVWSSSDLKSQGIADNSIVTLRPTD